MNSTEILEDNRKIIIEVGKSYYLIGYGYNRFCKVHITDILNSENENEKLIVFRYWYKFKWKYQILPDWHFAMINSSAEKHRKK